MASASSFPYPAAVAKSLDTYNAKRDFSKTPEPPARAGAGTAGNAYVIQKHAARRLHYDFRLELDGVMKSWAVPEGPSLIAGKKRLAVHVEDHPLEYAAFEGVIPPGQYGSGTVMIWDRGTWTPDFDPAFGYRKGHLKFQLDGQKLKGQWHLVRMAPKPREKQEAWLLFKSDDAAARPTDVPDILVDKPNSAATGRTMDAITRDQDRVWASGQGEITQPAKKRRRRKPILDPAALTKAKAGALPGFIEPSLPSPTDRAPSGRGWLHEIKHDGYRLQAHLENGRARLFSRQGLDWTERFPALAHALADLPVKVAIVDGEAVVHAETGVASFTALVDALKTGRGDMAFYAFDLLYLDGFDLRDSPLSERKAALAQIIAADGSSSRLRYSEHIEGDGDAVFRHASRLGLEGIISKVASSAYQSGRIKTWLKLKASRTDSFAIVGFIPSTVDKAAVSALVLGEYAGKKLVPVGHVGSGFTSASARELGQRLEPLRTATPPLKDETADAKGVRWVKPALSAEIEYRSRTGGGLIRHAVFRELVEGKTSSSQPREAAPTERKPRSKAASGTTLPVRLTNPGRLLWPNQGITKQGLAEFHAEIAGWILPHIVGRPLSLLRCPEGIAAQCFFQKHAWAGLGGAVRQIAVPNDEQRMLVIDDLAGLLELDQASVLEIHPWGAQAGRPELPDRVTIDLDPDDTVPWQRVIDAAHEVRRRLQASGLKSFVKTTGGKGLHVVFPLAPQADWDSVKAFAQSIAASMAADQPTLYTDNMAKSGRRGRIYVDYLRNGMGATAVGAYSTRARDGAPVSVPLDWDELGPDIRANHFTILNLPNRLAFLDRDPWQDIGTLKQTLPTAAVKRAERNDTVPAKAELAAYWKKVGKEALVHLARRPLDLVPHDPSAEVPKAVQRITVGDGHRFWIDSIDGLLGLARMAAVELHPWNATIDDLDHPDLLVFATDRGNDWQRTVATALRLHALLQSEGLESWPKLSGGPELHVMVPIEPELTWQEAQRYGKDIAGRLTGTAIDCRYNARGGGAIGAFSPRVLPGFPIAAPLDWDRLQRGVDPAGFTLRHPGDLRKEKSTG
ncbi:DNA ligase D [Reyranella sp.]|uniref:DNA ligase D n=1 Tax=Reyranella sp. TaxID=1929291 RepID=UPI003782E21A